MTTVIDTLHASAVTEELSDKEIKSIAGMFKVKGYKSGEAVVLSETGTRDNLSILADGNIKVKIPSGVGESTVCMLIPGDMADLNGFASGAAVNAKFYAVGDAVILSMNKSQFDNLVKSHPSMMCRVIHGMMHSFQSILRRMNKQVADLRDYVYSTNSRR